MITFYHFFKLSEPGKYNIQVCLGTACYLKGGQDIVDEIEKYLGVSVNGVSADRQFSLEAVRCVGCCGLSPVMLVGGEVFGKVEVDKLPDIFAKFKD